MNKKELIQTLYYIVEAELKEQLPRLIKSEMKRLMKPVLKELVILRQENKILEHKNRSSILINKQTDQKIEISNSNILEEIDPIKKILSETTRVIPPSDAEQGFQTMGEYTSADIHSIASNYSKEPINRIDTTFDGIKVPENELTNAVMANVNKNYSDFMKSVNEKVVNIPGSGGNDGDR